MTDFEQLYPQRDWATRERYVRIPDVHNDPRLFAETRCRVRRPFFLQGRRVEIDEIVTLERHDALSLAAIGRVEIVAGKP